MLHIRRASQPTNVPKVAARIGNASRTLTFQNQLKVVSLSRFAGFSPFMRWRSRVDLLPVKLTLALRLKSAAVLPAKAPLDTAHAEEPDISARRGRAPCAVLQHAPVKI
jgi:hypothetical protein